MNRLKMTYEVGRRLGQQTENRYPRRAMMLRWSIRTLLIGLLGYAIWRYAF